MPEAKRHHWIPRLILREFSTAPTTGNPRLARLDKKTGKATTSSVSNEAVIGQFNRTEMPMTGPWESVESGWATIEGLCKPALDRARGGEVLSEEDFHHIVMFTQLQHRRTPRMRQWAVELMEPLAQVQAQIHIGKLEPEKIRAWLQERQEDPVTDEQVERHRTTVLAALRDENLKVRASADHEVLAPFVAAGEVALELSKKLTLTVWRACAGSEFVLGDHPVSIKDASVPWGQGVGWLSSPDTRVAFPISRNVCLEFRPGRPGYAHLEATLDGVDDINLRSYAHAVWTIWGSAVRWVQETRALAKKDKYRTASYEPRKGHLFFFERTEGAAGPHAVTVHQPKEKTVRGFIRRRK